MIGVDTQTMPASSQPMFRPLCGNSDLKKKLSPRRTLPFGLFWVSRGCGPWWGSKGATPLTPVATRFRRLGVGGTPVGQLCRKNRQKEVQAEQSGPFRHQGFLCLFPGAPVSDKRRAGVAQFRLSVQWAKRDRSPLGTGAGMPSVAGLPLRSVAEIGSRLRFFLSPSALGFGPVSPRRAWRYPRFRRGCLDLEATRCVPLLVEDSVTGNGYLTGIEREVPADGLIVTKTDTAGRITYGNKLFYDISGYSEVEILGKPHNVIRHPHMPRVIFKLLWDTIQSGDEIFAYVVNRSKNGDHYWVCAHVTPSIDRHGTVVGYHSSRRRVRPDARRTIEDIYRKVLRIETMHESRKTGMIESGALLTEIVRECGCADYSRFVMSI